MMTPASWARPLDWLPTLSAYIAAAPPDQDIGLYLDARTADVDQQTVRALVERACTYLSDGLDFGQVVLLEGTVETPAGCEPVDGPADLLEHLDLAVPTLEDSPHAIVQHARWVKALVDATQNDIDRRRIEAAPRPQIVGLPLVTVRIPTYGSTDALLGRTIPSVLAGAYPNVEILVCSDGPQPHARAGVEAIKDPRVRYVELSKRPLYPSRAEAFWQTAGTFAVNRLLDEARGEFFAPLDHDDAFTFDHILMLLNALRQGGADFVFGQAMSERATGAWDLIGRAPLEHGHIVHSTVMYSRRLAHMRYDPQAWLLDEPGDWNLWRRMRDAGAVIHYVPATVAIHFKERSSIDYKEWDPYTREAETATDIVETAPGLLLVSSPLHGARGLPVRRGARPRAPAPEPPRKLALLDTHFPLWLSGFRWHEAKAMLELLPDMEFFSAAPTGESWPRPVHALADFPVLSRELGITDVYSVFLNFAVMLLGLQSHPGTTTCGGIPHDMGIAPVLWNRGIRFHTTLYPGGGLVTNTDPELMRAVAARSETVFTNTAEVVAAVPEAIRIEGPMGTAFYEYRERERRTPFQIVFAADDRPRKGLDTALTAFDQLDERFHLHIAGPNERYVQGRPRDRITLHGFLEQPKLRGLYWACDVFVSPVRPEGPDGQPGEIGLVDGFPTSTACEALASGCALISSNPRHEDWILTAGDHYLEVPAQDHVALAQALDLLERDRDLRDRLAKQGAARVRERMDVRRVAGAKLEAMQFNLARASAQPVR